MFSNIHHMTRSRGLPSLWWPLFIRRLMRRSFPLRKERAGLLSQEKPSHLLDLTSRQEEVRRSQSSIPALQWPGLFSLCERQQRKQPLPGPSLFCFVFFPLALKVFLTRSLVLHEHLELAQLRKREVRVRARDGSDSPLGLQSVARDKQTGIQLSSTGLL